MKLNSFNTQTVIRVIIRHAVDTLPSVIWKMFVVNNQSHCSLSYLAGALPHVLHVSVGDVGVGCGQWVIKLLGGVNAQEEHQGLMGQRLEGGSGRERANRGVRRLTVQTGDCSKFNLYSSLGVKSYNSRSTDTEQTYLKEKEKEKRHSGH